MDGNSPKCKELESELKNVCYDFNYAELRNYSKEEIADAEYFSIRLFPYPWEHDPEKDVAYYGTKFTGNPYDVDTRQQISPLYVDLSKVKKHFICQIIPETIVNNETMRSFVENEFTGIEFGKCFDYKGSNFGLYYQLKIKNVLPPSSIDKMYIALSNKSCTKPFLNEVDIRKWNIVR